MHKVASNHSEVQGKLANVGGSHESSDGAPKRAFLVLIFRSDRKQKNRVVGCLHRIQLFLNIRDNQIFFLLHRQLLLKPIF